MTRTSKLSALALVSLLVAGCSGDNEPGLQDITVPRESSSSLPTPSQGPQVPKPTEVNPTEVDQIYIEPRGPVPPQKEWLKDIDDALEHYDALNFLRRNASKHEKPMVNFDIDNTILQSSFGTGNGLTKKGKAIPAMKALIDEADKMGYFILFNTGRGDNKTWATKRQLEEAGLKYDALWLRPTGTELVEGKKLGRMKYVSQGYTLVASFGNHNTDLEGKPKALLNVKLPSYGDKIG